MFLSQGGTQIRLVNVNTKALIPKNMIVTVLSANAINFTHGKYLINIIVITCSFMSYFKNVSTAKVLWSSIITKCHRQVCPKSDQEASK